MRKIKISPALFFLPGLLLSCNLFGPVDPLAPTISTLEVVDVKRTEVTVNGTIDRPDFKNDRQEKKSGEIVEYGLVYGTSQNLSVETNSVVKLGTTGTLPLAIQNQKITGLTGNTQYYISLYARNEGAGMAYSPIVNIKTVDQPTIFDSKTSVSIKSGAFDLDAGVSVPAGDSRADITIDIFTITGRGTVLSVSVAGSTTLKNLGVTNYALISYFTLLNITDYKTEPVGITLNANTANTVIAFKTAEGRYGKWRIENSTANTATISLITYDK
ncbi:fibronectin type III domain-containing protein [Dyadobacter sp. CY323]|uniref:fibronectin type III domain-containing protein n=1 Tax=Dyadobacter sp. CY323 TaxID=2907302 RepID=UPI001F46FCCB|nr:fibronectin type III domain-containing protein [Dyadobacter sp. CY323]MCE6988895.1 fibronectin type III domain-containing protein [Dyadobacter sp. CY323]